MNVEIVRFARRRFTLLQMGERELLARLAAHARFAASRDRVVL